MKIMQKTTKRDRFRLAALLCLLAGSVVLYGFQRPTVARETFGTLGVIGVATFTGSADFNGGMTIDGGVTNVGGGTPGTAAGDNDLFVTGDLEVDGTVDLDATIDIDTGAAITIDGDLVNIGGGTGSLADGDNDLLVAGDLEAENDLEFDNDLTRAGTSQPMLQAVAFDIEEATMDADDGTGIKVESISLAFAGKITRAWVDVTQGHGDAGDTLELIINDTDDGATVVTTLVAAADAAAASLLAFTPASSTTVPLATISATNQYVLVLYKDVGDDGSTSANLQGTLYVEYMK